jgi:hypothetical protein
MKKVFRAFLIILVGLLIAHPVKAEFYSSISGLSYDKDRWVEAGTTKSFKSLYVYTCAGGTKYNKLGLYSGSIDPSVDRNKVKCDDGQTPSAINQVSNECHSNNTCSAGKQYYCYTTTNITCPPRKTTSTPTQPVTQPPKTETPTQRTKPTNTQTKTKKTVTKKTEAPTQPVTEAPTEPVTEPVTERQPSNNANIKSILINKKALNYYDDKSEYSFKISYGISSVNIEVELEDEHATYKVEGNTNLDDEKAKEDITITVTAEDGETTKTIKITAEKYKPSETDCTLANIYVKDYAINYERNTFDYSLTLGKEVNNLDIETVKQYDGQIVQVNGNEKLKNKSKIVIEVESPSGDICTYTIKVKKNSSVWKYIIIILVLLGALGIAGYVLYRYINKSNGLYKYE